MIRLADIGVLIALAERNHFQHAPARFWLRSNPRAALATCSLTEMGFLRVYGHPSYPGGPGSHENALRDLQAYRQRKWHCFLPCGQSHLHRSRWPDSKGTYGTLSRGPRRARFTTFNAGIQVNRVLHGINAIEVIPS